MKGLLFLVHWHLAEAEGLAEALRVDGWQVETEAEDGARAYKRILAHPPDAILIYLTRKASHGLETARALRSHKRGVGIPMVLVDNDAQNVGNALAKLPGAMASTPENLRQVLQELTRGRKPQVPEDEPAGGTDAAV